MVRLTNPWTIADGIGTADKSVVDRGCSFQQLPRDLVLTAVYRTDRRVGARQGTGGTNCGDVC